MSNGNKICVLSVYWGELPSWIPYFLASCAINQEIDFFLFSDYDFPEYQADNIYIFHLTLEQFNTLATKNLGFEVSLPFPYKVCDFKPAFGNIFKDYLIPYDFWGYCDIDIVFGRIRNFFTDEILNKYDIINTYRGFLSGPFCLFRNVEPINRLYQIPLHYSIRLKSKHYEGFDENIPRKKLEGINLHKVLIFILFFFKTCNKRSVPLHYFAELRYQFQWFYKIFMLKYHLPQDMTEMIWKMAKEGKIRLYHTELVLSGEYLHRIRRSHWKFGWKKKGLFDLRDGKEIFAFHFRGSKMNANFTIEKYRSQYPFLITEEGISLKNEK